jgi:sulfite reductase (ferredoxin)
VAEREKNESFKSFVQRIGKVQIKTMMDDLTKVPTHDEDSTLYTDWGDSREFTIGDIGVGECAGEVVSHAEFGLANAERQVFEAQVLLDENQYQKAGETAYQSMYQAALTLVEELFFNVPKDHDRVAEEFRARLYDTKLFWDEYAGGKFGHYYLRAYEKKNEAYTPDEAHRRVEEAQLVIEAAHSCYSKLLGSRSLPRQLSGI